MVSKLQSISKCEYRSFFPSWSVEVLNMCVKMGHVTGRQLATSE